MEGTLPFARPNGSMEHIAPNLFKNTKFKRRTIQKELHSDNWVKSLALINNPSLLDEFVTLSMMLWL
jgi:hypothetical protein